MIVSLLMALVVKDLVAKEPALKSALVKSITDYETRADVSLESLQAKYEEELLDNGTSTFGKIKAKLAAASRAGAGAAQALNDQAKAAYAKYFPTSSSVSCSKVITPPPTM